MLNYHFLIRLGIFGLVLFMVKTTEENLLASCRDTGRNFNNNVTVTSFSYIDSNKVCNGELLSAESDIYRIEFKRNTDTTSDYSEDAIDASMQTACRALEEAYNLGIEAIINGDIYECDIRGDKIKADYILFGQELWSSRYAFSDNVRGDSVSATDLIVDQYIVYSNQAHNHCLPYFSNLATAIFRGLVMVEATGGFFTDELLYSAAVDRCNTILDAHLENRRISIEGEIYNPYDRDHSIPADVNITSASTRSLGSRDEEEESVVE